MIDIKGLLTEAAGFKHSTSTLPRKMTSKTGILTAPISESGMTGTSNLVDIAKHFSDGVYLITGPEACDHFRQDAHVCCYPVHHARGRIALTRVLRFAVMQLKMSYILSKIGAQTDLWLFYIGGDCLVLPMLVAKLLRRKAFLVCAGSATETLIASGDLFSRVTRLLSSVNCTLADRLILYSPMFVEKWGLRRYDNKTIIAPRHVLDFNQFKATKGLNERDELVGYVGRLSDEKGVLNFVKAISFIMEENDRVHFSIAGDGRLRGEIEKFLKEHHLQDRVLLGGWIKHDDMADHLNRLKLVVIPSFTEGLPNLMLEAMACGTPVLATKVGAITDVIKDGETGFVMERNTPECIAANIKRALEYPYIDQVVDKANAVVKSEYSYERIVQHWGDVFRL